MGKSRQTGSYQKEQSLETASRPVPNPLSLELLIGLPSPKGANTLHSEFKKEIRFVRYTNAAIDILIESMPIEFTYAAYNYFRKQYLAQCF